MKTYQKIKRYCYDTKLVETFIATGQWANGNLAYSKLEEDGSIKDENDTIFVQVRACGRLMMVHI